MSKLSNTEVATSPPASNNPGSGSTSTGNQYQDLAFEIIANCEAQVARWPRLQVAHPAKAKFFQARQMLYDPNIVATSAVAVESDPQLQAVNSLSDLGGRDRLQHIEAGTELESALKGIVENVTFTNHAEKWGATLQAFQTYQIAKSLVRDPSSTLAGHVKNIAKVIKRKFRKGVPATPTTPPAPTTPPVPTVPTTPTVPPVPSVPATPSSHTVPQLPQATAATAT